MLEFYRSWQKGGTHDMPVKPNRGLTRRVVATAAGVNLMAVTHALNPAVGVRMAAEARVGSLFLLSRYIAGHGRGYGA